MNKEITCERLLELGNTLNGIIQELLESSETPSANKRKRRNLKSQRVAKYLNKLDNKYQKK